MLNFIRQLKDRYLREIESLSKDSSQLRPLRDNLSALRLAEAALLKQQLNLENPGHPLQIAVLGPTQAGKSTLLNFLTGSESAGVSALAGFTVHAQAYTVGVEPDDKRWAEILFDGFAQLQAKQLDPDDYLQYSIDSCNSKPLQNLAPCVLWDTPDFDSVHAYGYNSAVLRTLALADILVLIVSREKYADKSVWDLIQLSAPLDKPLLVCINKLDPGSDQAIVESFQQRFAEHNKDSKKPALIGIPFVRNLDKTASALPSPIRQQIFTELQKLAVNVDRQAQQASVYNFIEKHWEPWIGPVKAEHDAGKQWQDILQQTLSGAESQYKRDYLNNPENYDSFKRALAQLLILLEIPGVAKTLVKARQAITWPVRKLLSLGSEKLGHSEPQADIEQTVLLNICNNTLTSLLTQLDEQEEKQTELAGWWATLGKKLLENRESINHEFAARVDAYKAEFQQEIDRTAHDLYRNLEKQPATLNSLRAARVTADAAAVGLALKTGGIGLNDFLLAPAMLSVTSMLTESALGRYIDRVKAKLRIEQLDAVKSQLLEGYLKTSLLQLAEQSSASAQNTITEQALQEARSLLSNSRAE